MRDFALAMLLSAPLIGFLVWRGLRRPTVESYGAGFVMPKCAHGCVSFDDLNHGRQRCRACGWVRNVSVAACLLLLLIGCGRVSSPDGAMEIRQGIPFFGVPEGPIESDAGYQLILDYEVGGGQQYYDAFLPHPTVPPGFSGVTIGVGYDLRFSSRNVIHLDWYEVNFDDRDRLAGASGLSHSASKDYLPQVEDIYIDWPIAKGVFDRVTVGRFWQITKRAFPGVEALSPEAQWAVLSVTFNRGADMTGGRRKEMRELRSAVAAGDYKAMERAIRSMVRVWQGTDIERGMTRRRFAEALLISKCE